MTQTGQVSPETASSAAHSAQAESPSNVQDRLFAAIAPLVERLGFELVYIEAILGRQKVLRLFIDRAGNPDATEAVGIEDCVQVTRELDQPLDELAELQSVFSGPYELEISSPGIDRPLKREKDFERFSGREARIHTFRPLSADEIENSGYQQKNPKQKNFFGTLNGMRAQKVLFTVDPSGSAIEAGRQRHEKKQGRHKHKQAEESVRSEFKIAIPFSLISKAHLEPIIDWEQRSKP